MTSIINSNGQTVLNTTNTSQTATTVQVTTYLSVSFHPSGDTVYGSNEVLSEDGSLWVKADTKSTAEAPEEDNEVNLGLVIPLCMFGLFLLIILACFVYHSFYGQLRLKRFRTDAQTSFFRGNTSSDNMRDSTRSNTPLHKEEMPGQLLQREFIPKLTKISESPEDKLAAKIAALGLKRGSADFFSPTEYDDSLLSMLSRLRLDIPSVSGSVHSPYPIPPPPPDYYMSEVTHSYPNINMHHSQTSFSPYLHLTWVSPIPQHRTAFSDPNIISSKEKPLPNSIESSQTSTNPITNSYSWKSPFHPNYNTPVDESDMDANPLPPGAVLNRLPLMSASGTPGHPGTAYIPPRQSYLAAPQSDGVLQVPTPAGTDRRGSSTSYYTARSRSSRGSFRSGTATNNGSQENRSSSAPGSLNQSAPGSWRYSQLYQPPHLLTDYNNNSGVRDQSSSPHLVDMTGQSLISGNTSMCALIGSSENSYCQFPGCTFNASLVNLTHMSSLSRSLPLALHNSYDFPFHSLNHSAPGFNPMAHYPQTPIHPSHLIGSNTSVAVQPSNDVSLNTETTTTCKDTSASNISGSTLSQVRTSGYHAGPSNSTSISILDRHSSRNTSKTISPCNTLGLSSIPHATDASLHKGLESSYAFDSSAGFIKSNTFSSKEGYYTVPSSLGEASGDDPTPKLNQSNTAYIQELPSMSIMSAPGRLITNVKKAEMQGQGQGQSKNSDLEHDQRSSSHDQINQRTYNIQNSRSVTLDSSLAILVPSSSETLSEGNSATGSNSKVQIIKNRNRMSGGPTFKKWASPRPPTPVTPLADTPLLSVVQQRMHEVAGDNAEADTSPEEPQTSYQWDNYGFEGSETDPDKTLSPPEDHKTGNLAPPTTPVASTSFADLMSAEKELSELQSATSLSTNESQVSRNNGEQVNYMKTTNKAVTQGNRERSYLATENGIFDSQTAGTKNYDIGSPGRMGHKDKKNNYQYDNFPFYATVEAVEKDYSGIAYNSPTPVLSKNQFWV